MRAARRRPLRFFYGGLYPRGGHGHAPQPGSGGVVNGVGDDRAHDDDGRFSAALRRNVVGLDEQRLDFR